MTQVRFPNQKRLEKVPEALDVVFHDLDYTGIAAFSRGNGIYEITDAPLNTLRDRVREHVNAHLGGMVADKEAAFLEKCGIQARNGYRMSPTTSLDWLGRWSLLGTPPYSGPLKNFKIKIEIPKNTQYLHPQFIPTVTKLLRMTYLKLAWASGLKPSELPRTIRFVPSELTNHTALIAEAKSDLPKLCGQFAQKSKQKDTLGRFITQLDRALKYQEIIHGGKPLLWWKSCWHPLIGAFLQ